MDYQYSTIDLKENAIGLLERGFSVLPSHMTEKKPDLEIIKKIRGDGSAKWLIFKEEPITPSQARKYFNRNAPLVLLGVNGLILLDFDADKGSNEHERYDTDFQFKEFKKLLDMYCDFESERFAFIERSAGRGYHVVMYCDEVEYTGKKIIAATKNVNDKGIESPKAMIEFLQGSPMTIYGKRVIQGDLLNLEPTPSIIIDSLLEKCASWNTYTKKHREESFVPPKFKDEGIPIIEKFNQTYSVIDILLENGYVKTGHLRYKPEGKKAATGGVQITPQGTHCFSHHANDLLSGYGLCDAFEVYTILSHFGSKSSAINEAKKFLEIED